MPLVTKTRSSSELRRSTSIQSASRGRLHRPHERHIQILVRSTSLAVTSRPSVQCI